MMNISINKNIGNTRLTTFKLQQENVSQILLRIEWDMGDGTVYRDVSSVEHTYNKAGRYDVVYNSIDIEGNEYRFVRVLEVEDLIRDAIQFTNIPYVYSDPGKMSGTFNVGVTSTTIDKPLFVNLFAINSKSIPLKYAPIKYHNLVPTWRFCADEIDYSGVQPIIESMEVSTQPVTSLNDNMVAVTHAVTGMCKFRYIDDISTGLPHKEQPLLLNVTLQTTGFDTYKDSTTHSYGSFANSKVNTATLAWQVNYIPPGTLKLKYDNSTDIHKYVWTDTKIPLLITAQNTSTLYTDLTSTSIAYSYPESNSLTDAKLVRVNLLTSDSLSGDFNVASSSILPDNVRFQKTDYQGVRSSGFIYTECTPLVESMFTKISASVDVFDINVQQALARKEFVFPARYTPQPIAWINNSLEKKLTRVRLAPLPEQLGYTLNQKLPHTILGTVDAFDVEGTKEVNGFNYQLPGEVGIYAIAVLPYNQTVKRGSDTSRSGVVVLDSTNDTIHYYASFHNIDGDEDIVHKSVTLFQFLSTTQSYEEFSKQSSSPAYVSVDSKNNFWVSLFNRHDILKFDSNLNLLTSAVPSLRNYEKTITGLTASDIEVTHNLNTLNPQIQVFNYYRYDLIEDIKINVVDTNRVTITLPPNAEILNQYFRVMVNVQSVNHVINGDFTYKPPLVETDQTDNIWVSYNNIEESCIIKYDTTGKQKWILRLSGALSNYKGIKVCTSIVFDYNNNAYCIINCIEYGEERNISTYNRSILLHIDQDCNIKSTIDLDGTAATHACVDKSSNVWYISDKRNIGYLNVTTLENKLWYLEPNGTLKKVSKLYSSVEITNEDITGFTIDAFERLWVVDSKYNKTVCFYANTTLIESDQIGNVTNVKIYPNTTHGQFIAAGNVASINSNSERKSLYALGDFTGNKWYQKYAKTFPEYTLTGETNVFEVKSLFTSDYELRRKNESFDMTAHLFGLLQPDHMQEWGALKSLIFENVVNTDEVNVNGTYSQSVICSVYNTLSFIIQHNLSLDRPTIQVVSSEDNMLIDSKNYQVIYLNDSSFQIIFSISVIPDEYSELSCDIKVFNNTLNNVDSTHDNVGVKVYEKIANFLENNADINTCSLQQLQSFAVMLGVDFNTFFSDSLTEIQRFIDIASVPYDRLWGYAINAVDEDYDYTVTIGNGSDRIFTVTHDIKNHEIDVKAYVSEDASCYLDIKHFTTHSLVKYFKNIRSMRVLHNFTTSQIKVKAYCDGKLISGIKVNFKEKNAVNITLPEKLNILNKPIKIVLETIAHEQEIINLIRTVHNFSRQRALSYIYNSERVVNTYLTERQANKLKKQLQNLGVDVDIKVAGIVQSSLCIEVEVIYSIIDDNNIQVYFKDFIPSINGCKVVVLPKTLTSTDVINEGEFLGIKDLLSNKRYAISVPPYITTDKQGKNQKLTTYSVQKLIFNGLQLGSRFQDRFTVYKLKRSKQSREKRYNNLIDWESRHTSLDKSITREQWSDSSDSTVDRVFNMLLTRYLCLSRQISK